MEQNPKKIIHHQNCEICDLKFARAEEFERHDANKHSFKRIYD